MNKEQLLSIERPQSLCKECGATIEELDHHPTMLKLKEKMPERNDYCPDCWEFIKNDAYDSYWLTRRVHKEKKIPKLNRREKSTAVRALFESLWDQREAEDVDAHLFFVSHLLMKWGGLKWLRNATDDQDREVIVFENPATGDPMEIRSVPIPDEAANEMKERVEHFLREYAPDNEAAL